LNVLEHNPEKTQIFLIKILKHLKRL